MAAKNQNSNNNKAAGFVAVWVMLLCIALGFGGTMVMRKVRFLAIIYSGILSGDAFYLQFQTALAVGFFLGVVVMMSMQMFMLFVIFIGEADNTEGDDSLKSSYQAAAAFSFLLFMSYLAFGLVLARYRSEVVTGTLI